MSTTTTPTQSQAERAADEAKDRLPFGVLMARLGQETQARFRRALRPLELSAQHYIVLKQLEAVGAASQAVLADALGIDYSNLASVTAELNDRGLIERYRHEEDRRRYVVELSERGTEMIVQADEAINAGEQQMLGTLDSGEREQLWQLLRQVADAAELCPGTPVQQAEACAGDESA
jgi:DNA-binding MarR family transcriptional regulator